MHVNKRVNNVTVRELRILPFKPPEDRLSCGIAWKEWVEEIERQFRLFGIESPSDMKDALLIYGGRELSRLEKYLPEPVAKTNEYETVKTKLNEYYVPRVNKHYERFLFLKMRPYRRESILSYASRLREKANTCQFQDSYEDRLLEHLIQTIDNEEMIRKCMAKNWDLKQFLEKASRAEIMDLQVQRILCTQGRYTRQKEMKNSHSQQTTYHSAVCNYCGLSGVHPKGYNCPAYNKYCYRCQKLDHFARVCWSTRCQRMDRPGWKNYRRKNIDIFEEKIDKGNYTARHSNNRRVGENTTNSVQVQNKIEQNRELRLMKLQERNSTQSGNMLKRKLMTAKEECNKQLKRNVVSYNHEQIKQLKAELKGMKKQCNFLKRSLELAELNSCKEKGEIYDAHQNIVVPVGRMKQNK